MCRFVFSSLLKWINLDVLDGVTVPIVLCRTRAASAAARRVHWRQAGGSAVHLSSIGRPRRRQDAETSRLSQRRRQSTTCYHRHADQRQRGVPPVTGRPRLPTFHPSTAFQNCHPKLLYSFVEKGPLSRSKESQDGLRNLAIVLSTTWFACSSLLRKQDSTICCLSGYCAI